MVLKNLRILAGILLLGTTPGLAQVIDLSGFWKFHIGDDAGWTSKSFRDADWEKIYVPSTWEEEGFNGYDGFAWYRTTFDGRKLEKDGVYYLNLGYIDDADEAYLNDKLIGFSGQCPPKFKTAYNNERKYVLPSSAIDFQGLNTIAIRVFDVGDRGGIVDGEPGIFTLADRGRLLVDLQGIWAFSTARKDEKPSDIEEWEKIMVPAPWEFQGFKYDGFGWYRRTFTFPSNVTKEPLVLMLGKIDDFDEVYFNGKLIGRTNDGRRYGDSFSFEKIRVYELPQNLISRTGPNTIEVMVEDMGNIGGIYEGVIGITTRSNYQKYFSD